MDDLTPEEFFYKSIRAFVIDQAGSYPPLEDLPARWDRTPADARDPKAPGYLLRDTLIYGAMNWAHTKRWAWDGLNRLLVTLEDRREAIPEPLKAWACSVVARQARGTFKAPQRMRNNPRFASKDERDVRIMTVHRTLIGAGMTDTDAKEAIMTALVDDMDSETVRSVYRKMAKFSPFKPRVTKQAP